MLPEPTLTLVLEALVLGLIVGFGMGVAWGADRWRK